MKLKLIAFVYPLLSATLSAGQVVDLKNATTNNKDTIPRWTVGTDLLWLIDKNQLPPSNIQARRLLTRAATGHLYGRIRVGVDYMTRDSSNYTGTPLPGPFKEVRRNHVLRLGLITQKNLSNKWSYYFGADIGLQLTRYSYEKTLYLNFATHYQYILFKGHDRTNTISIHPLAGINFHVNRFVELSLESSITGTHESYKSEYRSSELPTIVFTEAVTHSNKEYSLKIIPIHFLNLNIHLR